MHHLLHHWAWRSMLNLLMSLSTSLCQDFVESEKITGVILSVCLPQIQNEKRHYSVQRAWNLPEVTKDVIEFDWLCETKRFWSLSYMSGVAAHFVLQGYLGGWFLVLSAMWRKSDVTCCLLPFPVLKNPRICINPGGQMLKEFLLHVLKFLYHACVLTSLPLLQILTMSARAM